MWSKSGVSGTVSSSSKGDRRSNGGSSKAKRSSRSDISRSDISKPASRSANDDHDSSRPGDNDRTQDDFPDRERDRKRKSSSSQLRQSDSSRPATNVDRPRGQEGGQDEESHHKLSHDASLMPNQFPNQTPLDYSLPSIRSDTSSGGFGLAAEYYNDQGESVARQPGVRPHTPIITDTEPHLMAALAEPNPPEETGHGAAAEFYNLDESTQSAASYQTATLQNQASYPSAATTGTATADVTASYSANPQRPTTKPGRASTSSKLPMMAVGAALAGAAGLGAAAYSHHQHNQDSQQGSTLNSTTYIPGSRPTKLSSNASDGVAYTAGVDPPSYSTSVDPTSRPAKEVAGGSRANPDAAAMSASYQQQRQHEHRGPVSKFLDWWQNHDDVRKMEEYTEYIGVCRYCFDPYSDPRDGPRKHRPSRKSSRDFRDRRRVDKGSRYSRASGSSSSDSEGGNKGLVAAGLAGFGLASAINSKRRRDFDDYSLKPGWRQSPTELDPIPSRSSGGYITSVSRRSAPNEAKIARDSELGAVASIGNADKAPNSRPQPLRERASGPKALRRRRSNASSILDDYPSSDGGSVGFFGKIFSPRSRKSSKTRRSPQSGIYKSDSLNSSLVSGLAYGRGEPQPQPRRGKTKREPTAKDASNALLGLGTAATLLASANSTRTRASRRQPELIAVRESKNRPSKPPLTRDSLYRLQQQSDNDWESASESEKSSSVDTGLAFGDFHVGRNNRMMGGSSSAVPTEMSKDSRQDTTRKQYHRRSMDRQPRRPSGPTLPTIAASPPLTKDPIHLSHSGDFDAAAVEDENRSPLRYIEPRPMSDFKVAPIQEDFSKSPRHDDPQDLTIQQPQPRPAVRKSRYEYDDRFERSAPDGLSRKSSRYETLPSDSRDQPYPDKRYSYPRPKDHETDLLAAGLSNSSIGPDGITQPKKPRSDSQDIVRDSAVAGAAAGVAGVVAGILNAEARGPGRRASQSVRFATDEAQARDSSMERDSVEPESEAITSGISWTVQDVYPAVAAVESPSYPRDPNHQPLSSDAIVPRRDKVPQHHEDEGSAVSPYSSTLPSMDTVPSIIEALPPEQFESNDLVHVQSEPQVEIRHQGQSRGNHEPILDDEIFDPNFFKRSRAASEPQSSQVHRRTASFVVADLERRYTAKPPTMAEFFSPPELSAHSSVLDSRVDADADSIGHIGTDSTRDLQEIRLDPVGRALPPIPRLNVIAPTPPSSYAGSVKDPYSRSTSPVIPGDDPEESVTAEPLVSEQSGKVPTPVRKITWADHATQETERDQLRNMEPLPSAQDGDIELDDLRARQKASAQPLSSSELSQSYNDEHSAEPILSALPRSEASERTSTESDVIQGADSFMDVVSENWNDVPAAALEGRDSRSSKKIKRSKKRRSQPSAAPWDDEPNKETGRRSPVLEEKANTSQPSRDGTRSTEPTIDKSQELADTINLRTDIGNRSPLQIDTSPPGGYVLPTDSSTDSLLELERGMKRDSRPEERRRSSMDAYSGLESYTDVPEMIRLPESRPGSPYGEYQSDRTSQSQDLSHSPTSPTFARTPSTTAVPLPFYRRTPQSPWTTRDSPASSPSVNDQSPTSAARRRSSRPTSMDFKSNEFRPLYLLERNRKPTHNDAEDLPSLPSSHTTSRASSVLDGDEIFVSARESVQQSPVSQASVHGDDIQGDHYLDSQQATPKAAAISGDIAHIPEQPLDDSVASELGSNHRELTLLRDGKEGTSGDSPLVSEQASQDRDSQEPSSEGQAEPEAEDESWPVEQSSRAKKDRKGKKNKKGRPTPILASSAASEPKALALSAIAAAQAVASQITSERNEQTIPISGHEDTDTAETPLTARRDSLAEYSVPDSQRGIQDSPQGASIPSDYSDLGNTLSLVSSVSPSSPLQEKDGEVSKSANLPSDMPRQPADSLMLSHDERPSNSRKAYAEEADESLGLRNDIDAKYTLIEEESFQNPRQSERGVGADTGTTPSDHVSRAKPGRTASEDETDLHPADVAIVDNLINRRQSDTHDQNDKLDYAAQGSLDEDKDVKSLDDSTGSANEGDHLYSLEPREMPAQTLQEPATDLGAQGDERNADTESFSWVSKGKKKGKKGRKGKQLSDALEDTSNSIVTDEGQQSTGVEKERAGSTPTIDDSTNQTQTGGNADALYPTEAPPVDEWAVLSKSKKRKDKKKNKGRAQDALTEDTGDETRPADSSVLKDFTQPADADAISNIAPTVVDAEDEWATPTASKSKSSKKKLRFSIDPAEESSAGIPKDTDFTDRDNYSSTNLDVAALIEEGGATSKVPGAFPKETSSTNETHDEPPFQESRPTRDESDELETSLDETEPDNGLRRIDTADFLEDLREEEDQSPDPYTTTASYTERRGSTGSFSAPKIPKEDVPNDTPKEDDDRKPETRTEDVIQGQTLSEPPNEPEFEWDTNPKSKKKSKKGKNKDALEQSQAEPKNSDIDEAAEKAETSDVPKSSKGKKGKKDKKSKKGSFFSLFQSSDAPKKSKTSKRDTAKDSEQKEDGNPDSGVDEEQQATAEVTPEPQVIDTEDFMEQEELLEGGFAENKFHEEDEIVLENEEIQGDGEIPYTKPEIEAERMLAIDRALEEDRPLPDAYARLEGDQPQGNDLPNQIEGRYNRGEEMVDEGEDDLLIDNQQSGHTVEGSLRPLYHSATQDDTVLVETDASRDEENTIGEGQLSETLLGATVTPRNPLQSLEYKGDNLIVKTDLARQMDETHGSIIGAGLAQSQHSPVEATESQTPLREQNVIPPSSSSSSPLSKKERKKAKKAKKKQWVPLDELQVEEGYQDHDSTAASLARNMSSLGEEEMDWNPANAPDEEAPLPVAISSGVAVTPTETSTTDRAIAHQDYPGLHRTRSTSPKRPSLANEQVGFIPRSISNSREDVEFATTLAAGLRASGFDQSVALHGSEETKSESLTRERSMIGKDSDQVASQGETLTERRQEPAWSFSQLDESTDKEPKLGRHARDSDRQDGGPTFNDIIAAGLGSAGFDPRAATKPKIFEQASAPISPVQSQKEVVENEIGTVTMRTPSPQGPAEQWLSSSRRTSPVSMGPKASGAEVARYDDVPFTFVDSRQQNAKGKKRKEASGTPEISQDSGLKGEADVRSSQLPSLLSEDADYTRDESNINRDSALEMLEETSRARVSSSNQQTVRDSGYHDTMPTTPASRTSEFHRNSADIYATPPGSPSHRPASPLDSALVDQGTLGDSEIKGLQRTVEDAPETHHDAHRAEVSSKAPSPPREHYRSHSHELDTIVEGRPQTLSVDEQRDYSARNSGSTTFRVRDNRRSPGAENKTNSPGDRPASTGVEDEQRQLHRTFVSPTSSDVTDTRRAFARSSANASPLAGYVRPPSALSVRSRTPGSVVSSQSGSQTLRRSNPSSDLGAEYKRGAAQAPGYPANNAITTSTSLAQDTGSTLDRSLSYDPLKGSGRVSSRDMSDTGIHEGPRDARESPRSPSRPQGVRGRQSLQVVDLESRLDQAKSENRADQDAKDMAGGPASDYFSGNYSATQDDLLRQKDIEINTIRSSLETLQQEVLRLTEHNEQLAEANRNLSEDTNQRYAAVQAEHDSVHQQWQQTSRELEHEREQHHVLRTGMEAAVGQQVSSVLSVKNAEIQSLRDELSEAAERIGSLQSQISQSSTSRGAGTAGSSEDFLRVRSEDFIDSACHQLCAHVQQWILRFSKFSDTRPCRLSPDVHDEAIESRLDNAVLDGTDVDTYLAHRIKRRDIFMSLTMTMIWEYVFTRYLFGMDRAQRQTLKNLEKTLSDVGPQRAVAQWRATTLTLLSRRESFAKQRETDTEAVVQQIFSTLSTLLPPPQNLVNQILSSLRNVLRLAVDLSIDMRTQRPEYVMLPPRHPEYDTNGDLVGKVYFNASLMNERSGDFSDNAALEDEERTVRIVLFPPVVRKGDERGEGSQEVVVAPAQVLVSRSEAEEKRGAAGSRGANTSARSARGLGAEYLNRSQMSLVAPSANGSGLSGDNMV